MNEREMDLDDLPPTLYEIEQRRFDLETRRNHKRERIRIRRDNDKKGHAEPVPGTTLYVQLDGSVTKRNRSGIRFERGQQVSVTVIDADDAETKAQQETGKLVVNVYGAERILEDSALHVYAQPTVEHDVEALKTRNSALEEELRVTRADRDELHKTIRDARMGAKDAGDGKPARLQAAAAARAAAAQTSAPTTEHSEFGAPAPDKK